MSWKNILIYFQELPEDDTTVSCWHVYDFNLPCGFVFTAVAVARPEALSFEVEKEL